MHPEYCYSTVPCTQKLEKQGHLEALKEAVKKSPYNIGEVVPVTIKLHLQFLSTMYSYNTMPLGFLNAQELRHYVYKSRKTSCLTSPALPVMYSDQKERERLFELYMFMQKRIQSVTWPTKILYHIGEKEALLGWVSGFYRFPHALIKPWCACAAKLTVVSRALSVLCLQVQASVSAASKSCFLAF